MEKYNVFASDINQVDSSHLVRGDIYVLPENFLFGILKNTTHEVTIFGKKTDRNLFFSQFGTKNYYWSCKKLTNNLYGAKINTYDLMPLTNGLHFETIKEMSDNASKNSIANLLETAKLLQTDLSFSYEEPLINDGQNIEGVLNLKKYEY